MEAEGEKGRNVPFPFLLSANNNRSGTVFHENFKSSAPFWRGWAGCRGHHRGPASFTPDTGNRGLLPRLRRRISPSESSFFFSRFEAPTAARQRVHPAALICAANLVLALGVSVYYLQEKMFFYPSNSVQCFEQMQTEPSFRKRRRHRKRRHKAFRLAAD